MIGQPPDSFSYGIAFPGSELQDFVSHFWYSRFHTGVQNYFSWHATANTNTELVFAFAGDSGTSIPVFSSAQGHTGTYSCIETGGFSEMFGVSIYSHAVPFFFDVSPLEFAGQLTALKHLTDASFLLHQLAAAVDFNQRVALLTNYLLKRYNRACKKDLTVLHAIKYIRERRGLVNIASLAGDVSLSQKQFERRFKNFSGFNPKLYASILRFESSLCRYSNLSRLTDLALDLGYYDQAHFINDFKRFSGFSPGRYAPITLKE